MVGDLKGFAGHKLGCESKEIDEQKAEKENEGDAVSSGPQGFLHRLSYEGVSKSLGEGFRGRESTSFWPEDLCLPWAPKQDGPRLSQI